MSNKIMLPRLLTEEELCLYLKKSQAWAQRARLEGNGPPFVKIGRTPMYSAIKVEHWIMKTERISTCEEVRS